MKTRHAHTNYNLLKPYLDAAAAGEDGGYLKLTSDVFEPLCVEKLWYTDYKGRPAFSIMQYGIQNGDLMRDPDIEFSVDHEAQTIHPLSYRNDYLGVYQPCYMIRESDGKQLHSPRRIIDLDEFLWQWLKTLKDQGLTPAQKGA